MPLLVTTNVGRSGCTGTNTGNLFLRKHLTIHVDIGIHVKYGKPPVENSGGSVPKKDFPSPRYKCSDTAHGEADAEGPVRPEGSWVEITDGKALLKGTTERPHYAVGGLLNLQTRSGAPTCSGLWSKRERKVYGFF